MIVIEPTGNRVTSFSPDEIATYLSQGAGILYQNGAQAVVSLVGNGWIPDYIRLDGVPLRQVVTLEANDWNAGQQTGGGTTGGSNGGSAATGTNPARFAAPGKVWRLVIPTAPGRVDTGATYAGCSQENNAACQPVQFASIQAAWDYAEAHNEVPHLVGNPDEAWDVVYGRKTLSNTNWGLLVAGGAALWYFLKRRR